MGNLSLLQFVQAATAELGLPQPNNVIGAADNTTRQLGALANRLGQFLLRDYNWTTQQNEFHITVPPPIVLSCFLTAGQAKFGIYASQPPTSSGSITGLLPSQMIVSGTGLMTSTRLIAVDTHLLTATVDQPAAQTISNTLVTFSQDTFTAPPDFERAINRTQWDRTMRWELRGPQLPQADQWVRSGIVATGPRRHYRIFGNMVRIWPAPSATTAPAQLITEYISNYWVMSVGGAEQSKFLADTDTCVFDDDVMVMGLKYLFFQAKGFEYTEFKQQFLRAVQSAEGSDGSAPTLEMGRTRIPILISPANVQDAQFGGAFGNP